MPDAAGPPIEISTEIPDKLQPANSACIKTCSGTYFKVKTGSVETATTVTNQYLVVRTHVDALSQAGLLPFLHMGLIGGMKGGAGQPRSSMYVCRLTFGAFPWHATFKSETFRRRQADRVLPSVARSTKTDRERDDGVA